VDASGRLGTSTRAISTKADRSRINPPEFHNVNSVFG
jgi:hypothetical protein